MQSVIQIDNIMDFITIFEFSREHEEQKKSNGEDPFFLTIQTEKFIWIPTFYFC